MTRKAQAPIIINTAIICDDVRAKIRGMDDAQVDAFAELLDMVHAAVKIRRNLMSRGPVVMARDTPISCDPSSETYWSM